MSYKGQDRAKKIYIYLHNEHYDVITSMTGFCGSKNYCDSCEKPYEDIIKHSCPSRCYICFRLDCQLNIPIRCRDCGRRCQSSECFSAHKELKGKKKTNFCDDLYQCKTCSKVIRRQERPQHLHQCGEIKCKSCKRLYCQITIYAV